MEKIIYSVCSTCGAWREKGHEHWNYPQWDSCTWSNHVPPVSSTVDHSHTFCPVCEEQWLEEQYKIIEGAK